jgi:dihydrofolate reductase
VRKLFLQLFVFSDDVVGAGARLKEEPGNDVAIFGSSELSRTLADHGLIDEYRIFVVPVILGQGRRFVEGTSHQLDLTFQKSSVSSVGIITSYYAPIGART